LRYGVLLAILAACGDDAATVPDAPVTPMIDASGCLPQSSVGAFYRRPSNPRLVAGGHTFTDNDVDTAFEDPDLLWDGTSWHLYYSSPHGTFAAPGASIIRHATSTDLTTWTIQDAPAAMGTQPSVAIFRQLDVNELVMLYQTGSGIAIATSPDGASFTANGSMLAPPDASLTLSDPELAFVDDTFHVWFTATSSDVHGIGHATSKDLASWQFDSIPITSLQRGTQPTVVYDELHCRWEMWLSNDQPTDTTGAISGATAGYWHATSTNATSWSISYQQLRDVVWMSTENGEHLGLRPGADVASKNGGRYMLYTGFDNGNVPANSTLPTATGTTPGVMTLNLATRDVITL
jgi:hypothetical protein